MSDLGSIGTLGQDTFGIRDTVGFVNQGPVVGQFGILDAQRVSKDSKERSIVGAMRLRPKRERRQALCFLRAGRRNPVGVSIWGNDSAWRVGLSVLTTRPYPGRRSRLLASSLVAACRRFRVAGSAPFVGIACRTLSCRLFSSGPFLGCPLNRGMDPRTPRSCAN